jgi:hypothetical protein
VPKDSSPKLVFPYGFDDRDKIEAPDRGCFGPVIAQLPDGKKYAITFYDPTRLAQDLASVTQAGSVYFAEPGLIVLSEVTEANMRAAVKVLEKEGFFEYLRPLDDARIKKLFPLKQAKTEKR